MDELQKYLVRQLCDLSQAHCKGRSELEKKKKDSDDASGGNHRSTHYLYSIESEIYGLFYYLQTEEVESSVPPEMWGILRDAKEARSRGDEVWRMPGDIPEQGILPAHIQILVSLRVEMARGYGNQCKYELARVLSYSEIPPEDVKWVIQTLQDVGGCEGAIEVLDTRFGKQASDDHDSDTV